MTNVSSAVPLYAQVVDEAADLFNVHPLMLLSRRGLAKKAQTIFAAVAKPVTEIFEFSDAEPSRRGIIFKTRLHLKLTL